METTEPGVALATLQRIAYLLVAFPIATIAFAVSIVLTTTGAVLTPIVGGLYVLVGALVIAGAFATVERTLQRVLLQRMLPPAHHRPAAGKRDIGLGRLRDPQAWLELLWSVLGFVVSVITMSITVTWIALASLIVLTPLEVALPQYYPEHFVHIPGWNPGNAVYWAMELALGLVALLTLPIVTKGLVAAQAGLASALLARPDDLSAKVESLEASRDAGRNAEADQLRRLERDLHDGPQQRLVRLNMDLARAERSMPDDPEKAAHIIAEARANATDTLNELRDLSRRVAPPVLVDRGLRAAITQVAAQSSVPVTVDILDERLPMHVETAAYYVASEGLANVNKHANARHATISVQRHGDDLAVTVADDGTGGADASKGHGLAGLQERLRGVDGRLFIDSPDGGPTMVQAVIPCGS